jgi:hypothetical protein
MSVQPTRLDFEELQQSLHEVQQMLAHLRLREGEPIAPRARSAR